MVSINVGVSTLTTTEHSTAVSGMDDGVVNGRARCLAIGDVAHHALVDVYRSITNNAGRLTAAIHIALDSVHRSADTCRQEARHGSCIVADVDLWVGGCGSGFTEAATEYVTLDCTIDDVHHRRSCHSSIGSKSRCLTTTIHIVKIQRTASQGIDHVHRDDTSDIAVHIATAKGVGNGATKDIKGDVTSDVGRFTFTTL